MTDLFEIANTLQEKFPLFEYKIIKTRNPEYVQVVLRGGVTTGVTELNEQTLQSLQREHDRKQIAVNFMNKYPHLYPYVGHNGTIDQIWVKRDGRDADAIPHATFSRKTPSEREQIFAFWERRAEQATQDGWFLCFICGMPKPRSEYGYYHFCAEYCKDCLKKHPDVERSARNENYE